MPNTKKKTNTNNITHIQTLPHDKTSLFTPNPYLSENRLVTAHHNPVIATKVKSGYMQEAVKLVHVANSKHHEFTVGWVTTRVATPKRAQHKIMVACFGSDGYGLIVRDKEFLNLMADHLQAPFTVVSNRMCRTIGLIKHAIEYRCTAVYTPEGYDDYLIQQLTSYIHKHDLKIKLITKMDGGLIDVT